jgi:hypothetical protein
MDSEGAQEGEIWKEYLLRYYSNHREARECQFENEFAKGSVKRKNVKFRCELEREVAYEEEFGLFLTQKSSEMLYNTEKDKFSTMTWEEIQQYQRNVNKQNVIEDYFTVIRSDGKYAQDEEKRLKSIERVKNRFDLMTFSRARLTDHVPEPEIHREFDIYEPWNGRIVGLDTKSDC